MGTGGEDHDDMTQRPSENRIEEAVAVGVNHFTVACPKDMTMYADAAKTSGNEETMAVKDIIDFVLEAMDLPEEVEEQEPIVDEMEPTIVDTETQEDKRIEDDESHE